MKQIRRFRQAAIEGAVKVKKQEEVIWSLDRDVEKCTEIQVAQSLEITSLRGAMNRWRDKDANYLEQINIHIENTTAYKKEARLWKGIAIVGVTLVVVGAGAIAYIVITTP